MPRKIHISKYQGNTHYSIHVEDSFGQEHHWRTRIFEHVCILLSQVNERRLKCPPRLHNTQTWPAKPLLNFVYLLGFYMSYVRCATEL